MHPSRLRSGEIAAGLGALLLLLTLFLRWYTGKHGYYRLQDGWGSLGWLALVPIVLAIAAALALVLATLTERGSTAIPVAIGVVTVPLGLLATLAVAVRLLAEPGLGYGLTDAQVDVGLPAFLGLAGAVAILVGAWIAIGDERTGSSHARAQTEQALSVRGNPRPVPPRQDQH
jgi:hypothetical protein